MKKNSLLKVVLSVGLLSLLFSCNTTTIPSMSSFESSISSEDFSSSSEEPSSSEESSSSTLPIVPQEEGAILVETVKFKNESYKVGLTKSSLIKPSILPADAAYREVYYESSDPSIFKVNSVGYVTGLSVGEATLTAYALDGSGVSGSTKIVVFGTEVTSISLSQTSKDCGVGESFKLAYTLNPASATYKELNWESSDISVATVKEDGTVTCVAPGKATIKVSSKTNPAAFAECFITVTMVELRGFHIANRQVYMHVGENFELTPKFTPANASYKDVTYTSSDTSVVAVNSLGNLTAKKEGKVTISAVTKSKNITDQIKVEVYQAGDLIKSSLNYTYLDYGANNIYSVGYCPSVGDVNALVIPIWFTDSTNYISADKRDGVRNDIESAFFGANSSTGWRSVKTYYADESHHRFSLNGTVTNWFECGAAVSAYKSSGSTATVQLLTSAIEWVNKMYPSLDLKDYDSNGDGSLDAVIMVYAAPDYNSLRDWNSSNLWAYCNWTQRKGTPDNPQPNGFMWASYDFMYGSQTAYNRTGKNYGYGDTSRCSIDAHTFIHEFGHLLGLSDYYDYSSQYSPTGGFSMQDQTTGAHDPYSLVALGWIDPFIPTNDVIVNLGSTNETGDVILLTNQFNNIKSPFDEYLLLEFYTPTGVNEFDAPYNMYQMSLTKYGIRVWHVDARLLIGTYTTISKGEIVTNDPYHEAGKNQHMMSNTYYKSDDEENAARITFLGKEYADYNLLQFIRKDDNTDYRPRWAMSNSDLFVKGDTFNVEKYGKQFKNTGKMNDGEPLEWSFYVEDVTNDIATIELTKTA